MKIQISPYIRTIHPEIPYSQIISTLKNPDEKYFDKQRSRHIHIKKVGDRWLILIYTKDPNINVMTAFYAKEKNKHKYVRDKIVRRVWTVS